MLLQDQVSIPKDMCDALDSDDPVGALQLLAAFSREKASTLGHQLQTKLDDWNYQLPSLLRNDISPDHPIQNAIACSDSIYHSLTKIASGGSQASQEIRQLEDAKRQVEQHAQAIQMALELRQESELATQALQAQSWYAAAEAIRPWLEWSKNSQVVVASDGDGTDHTKEQQTQDPRTRDYAGDYALQQLQTAHDQLSRQVLELYKVSVAQGDLKTIGQLTPVLSLIQLDKEAVSLYLQFLKSNVLEPAMQQAVSNGENDIKQPQPPFAPMARVYNAAVNALRHHLPLVSHCLYKADGDAAVVQLVHAHVEQAVLPLFRNYQRERQLQSVSVKAVKIYAALEERYTGRGALDESAAASAGGDDADDCGFSGAIGSLSDVDAAMEEAAICIQHSESYLRFLHHTCSEINKARQFRWEREKQATRWTADDTKEEFAMTDIISPMTHLHQTVAEVGGQYASIEHCLLLASMQRAFVQPETDARYFHPLSLMADRSSASNSSGARNQALQTAMVDTCLYAARHCTQRALATGHTGTASAMTNFCVDCLNDILLEVLSHRAEEGGVALLKPGEGLLVGSAGIFNASNLIRQGTTVAAGQQKDVLVRKQQQQEGIARACAMINDLEVAIQRLEQLETMLMATVDKGYPNDQHTEQLRMCVRSLRTVTDGFKIAADATIESLESVLKSRIRSIVGEAVGGEGGVGFMTSMGAGKVTDRVTARLNYNLDDDMYNLVQLSEGYIAHLCSLLDELVMPLQTFLAPRLWDNLLLSVVATVSKRLETSLRKCEFTSLGALSLDTDMRDLLSYTKDKLYGAEYQSTPAITKACPPLSRLLQISKLLNVDDLDDVLDLISSLQRKKTWELKLEDAKAFLSARVEFEASKVNELLRIPDDN